MPVSGKVRRTNPGTLSQPLRIPQCDTARNLLSAIRPAERRTPAGSTTRVPSWPANPTTRRRAPLFLEALARLRKLLALEGAKGHRRLHGLRPAQPVQGSAEGDP